MRHPTPFLAALLALCIAPPAAAGDLLKSQGYAMVRISGASWTRGGPGGDADEAPAHTVAVTRPFSLGRTEVTQGLYEAVTGSNPSATEGRNWRGSTSGGTCAAHGVGRSYPATCVTWTEAVFFCNRLSELEGLTPAYRATDAGWTWDRSADGYRLPTEAEWELAEGNAPLGSSDLCENANVSNESSAAHADALQMVPRVKRWFECDDGAPGLAEVGSRSRSGKGLEDMLGNVWEWTWDAYGEYPSVTVIDPIGPSGGATTDRVLRGGSWANPPGDIRTANRFKGPPDGRSYLVGFRIARSAPSPAADPVLVKRLGAGLAGSVAAARAAFDSAKTDDELAAAYHLSLAVSSDVGSTLDTEHWDAENSGRAVEDFSRIDGTVPGMVVGSGAEGMGVATRLEVGPWIKKAKGTAGAADDTFFALMSFVYGAADRSWAVWEVRNWDYGGCSGLGSGVVVRALVLADEALAAGEAFGGIGGAIRATALGVVMKGDEYFPYCTDMEPTPDERLRDEARQILGLVRLSPAERAALEARIPKLKGAEASGG